MGKIENGIYGKLESPVIPIQLLRERDPKTTQNARVAALFSGALP